MTIKRLRWLDALLETQGAPYVWGGHGWDVWDKDVGLRPHSFGIEVFDCAGLITTTLWKAGGPDWRKTHNAQTLYDVTMPSRLHNRPLNLLFYGRVEAAIEHVAVVVGCSACDGPVAMVKIEAAGGGRGTLAPRSPLGVARVMLRRENRTDFIAERILSADVLESMA